MSKEEVELSKVIVRLAKTVKEISERLVALEENHKTHFHEVSLRTWTDHGHTTGRPRNE